MTAATLADLEAQDKDDERTLADFEAQDADPAEATRPTAPPRLERILEPSLVRVHRRCEGIEKPILLPWPVLADHFGGGLWPGFHVLNAATGIGKTQFAMQAGAHAASSDVPVLYIGLELGELDLALRVLGDVAKVKWSHMWTGKAGPDVRKRAHAAVATVSAWPFHYEVARPHGFPASAIRAAVEGMRGDYPEPNGPGSRPMLVLVDFLQLVGDEPGDEVDLRIRIARASYALRALVNEFSIAVLCISSIARERVKLLSQIREVAELTWKLDEHERPIERRILAPDAIVGAGKESGEIEYAADSVTVMARATDTWDGSGCDVVVATAKGRATGANWSPLHFTGFSYVECEDRGGRMVQAWEEADQKRDRERAEKKTAKEAAKMGKLVEDARAVAVYVLEHPSCTVTQARVRTVANNHRRWSPAVALLDGALSSAKVGKEQRLTLDHTRLPEDVRATMFNVQLPPVPPLVHMHTVHGQGPTVCIEQDVHAHDAHDAHGLEKGLG